MMDLPGCFHFFIVAVVIELAYLLVSGGVYVYGRIQLRKRWFQFYDLNGNRTKYDECDFKERKRILADKSSKTIDIYRFSKFCMAISIAKIIIMTTYLFLYCPSVIGFLKATLLP